VDKVYAQEINVNTDNDSLSLEHHLTKTLLTDVPVVLFAFILLRYLVNDISKEMSLINDNLTKLFQELKELKDRLLR